MKILYVLCDNPFKASCGLGNSVKKIIEGLIKINPNINIQILSLGNEFGYEKINKNIEVFSYGEKHSILEEAEPILHNFSNSANACAYGILNLNKPDIIHIQDWSSILVGSALNSYWGGNIKTVYTTQLSLILMVEDLTKFFKKVPVGQQEIIKYVAGLEQEQVISSDCSIFLNSEDKKRLNGIKNSLVIPHGVNLKEIESIPFEKKYLPGNRPVKILYYGRFDYMKNIVNLYETNLPENVDLIFMGGQSGSHPDVYEKLMKKIKEKDNLHHIPFTTGDEKINIIRSADCVVFPSIHEPYGLVGIETLACGTPLIASFVGGMNEYLNEECAIKMNGLESKSIEEAIYKFLNMSEKKKENMIKSGKDVCKRHSWNKSIIKHYEIYTQLLEEK